MKEDLVQQRKAEIISGALKVFVRKGYHNSTIADIATELGIGHGTIYRYYKNKLDIFCHVIDKAISEIAALISTESPETSNSLEEYREQLNRIGKSMSNLFSDNEDLIRILLNEALVNKSMREKIMEAVDLFAQYTERYLKNGLSKGFLRQNLDTHTTAYAVNAMIIEATRHASISKKPEETIHIWTNAIVSIMMEGISAH